MKCVNEALARKQRMGESAGATSDMPPFEASDFTEWRARQARQEHAGLPDDVATLDETKGSDVTDSVATATRSSTVDAEEFEMQRLHHIELGVLSGRDSDRRVRFASGRSDGAHTVAKQPFASGLIK